MEIPGYYYDAEKKKFFRIANSSTAPSSSTSYSSDAVKRRKVRDESRKAARDKATLVKRHIKRHHLQRSIVTGGLLSRELEYGFAPEDGRARRFDEDIGGAAWTGGLQSKGSIPFMPSFAREREVNMGCFWVGVGGVAYGTLDEETLLGTYISSDKNDLLLFGADPLTSSRAIPQFRTELVRCPQMSSIKYHESTHRMLLTSREPNRLCGLRIFSPWDFDVGTGGRWLLGEGDHYHHLTLRHSASSEWVVHKSTPAPPSSNLLCVMGTNAGIVCALANDTLSCVAPSNPPKGTKLPREIFDQDFQHSNHNVVLAGGRQPRLWITDLRTPVEEWSHVRQPSSIAHLRSVNEHHVLTAGLTNKMGLYDMRFFKQNANGATPLLTFPDYRNTAHLDTGWDVCTELGIVAAAHDDGTVKLFSLTTGRVLRSRALQHVKTDTPLKALMFSRISERDKMPSLWLGKGMALRKFSFGTQAFGDEA